MNTITKGIGLFILVVTICVIWSWPHDKKMSSEEVAQEVATVTSAMTEEMIEASTQAIIKKIEAQLNKQVGNDESSQDPFTPTTTNPVESVPQIQDLPEIVDHHTGRSQRFANRTTLPADTDKNSPGQPTVASYDDEDFADQVFSSQKVRIEPSNEEYRAAQKRLNENILSLEKVIANFK